MRLLAHESLQGCFRGVGGIVLRACLLGIVSLLWSVAALCDSVWHIETAASGGHFAGYTSIELDADGWPHVSYFDDGLWYAVRDASGWTVELADAGSVGWYSSLALDETEFPHISHYDWDMQALKYTYFDSGQWQTEVLDSDGEVGRYCWIAFSPSGVLHIVYEDRTNGDLKHAWLENDNWQIEIVDAEGNTGYYPSIAFSPDGVTHISYYTRTLWGLLHAWQEDGQWHTEVVDTQDQTGLFTSIAVTSEGYPRIAYLNATNRDLMFAWKDESGWHTQVVDSEGDVGFDIGLALDTQGYAHISYLATGIQDLKYAKQTPQGWVIETVDSEGSFGWYTSIAIDRSGFPHISSYAYQPGRVRCARFGPDIVEVSAPEGWVNAGWNWFGIPLEPVGSLNAARILGDDPENRLFSWDRGAKTYLLYPDDFEDLWRGDGYILLSQYDLDPGYSAYQDDDEFQIWLPLTGWSLISTPRDYPVLLETARVGHDGQERTAFQDAESPDPWLNWNLVYWNSYTESAEICTLEEGAGDDESLRPWFGYWAYSMIDDVTLIIP